ncbi:MAG: immunoglobulin domain-containing protein [Verrucomicrobiae bacterium]|nr:immunoglobulin domain-containing protein [Verrucomicrobiae bacterium]
MPYHSLMLALGIAFTASASAQTISFNVDNNSTVGGDGAGSFPASPALAGATGALADYWTNDWPTNDLTDLRDSTGVDTTMDIVSPRPFNTYPQQGSHPGVDTDGSWNKEMLNGYVNGGHAGNNPATITLNQIPYTSYDVYVYFASDDATRTGTVTDGTTTYRFGVLNGQLSDPSGNALLVQTTNTTDFTTEANYAVFTGLSGASQTFVTEFFQADTTTGSFGGISAIQVVNTGTLPAIPDFTLDPVNTTANAGAMVSLDALAPADPEPSYQWEYSEDGVNDWMELSGETGPSLVIPFAILADVGYYRCVATNDNGSDTSAVAYLDVVYAPPSFKLQPNSQYVDAGATVILTGDANTFGAPGYQWYKNGSPMPGEESSTLTFGSVALSDEGQYFLRVTDLESNLFTDSNVVTVAVKDIEVTSSDTAPVTNGGDISFFPVVATDAENINGGLDDNTYIAWDRASQGMSFTTGNDPLGYSLNSITIQQVSYNTYADVKPGDVFEIAFGTLSGTTKTPIYEADTAIYVGSNIDNADSATAGGGWYLTFDLSGAGIPNLSPSTEYYFEITARDGTGQVIFIEWNGASAGGYAGGEAFSGDTNAALTPTYVAQTGDRAFHADLTALSAPSDDFATWIGGYDVGGMTGFTQDPDFDGISSGVENFFGTAPDESTTGISDVTKTGANTFTFQHPQNAAVASDVSAAYRWSVDLVNWNADGAANGGTTVSFAASTDTPTAGTTTVTATVTGTVPQELFVDIEVTKTDP